MAPRTVSKSRTIWLSRIGEPRAALASARLKILVAKVSFSRTLAASRIRLRMRSR